MCEECRKRAALIPQGTITAIEAHKAELIELLAEINDAANHEVNKETLESGHVTRELLGSLFAPYVIGYIIGMTGANPKNDPYMVGLFVEGIQNGADILNSREVH